MEQTAQRGRKGYLIMPEIEIRRATIDDAEVIATLCAPVQQIHVDARPDFFRSWSSGAVSAEIVNHFVDILYNPDHYVFIAALEGDPVGYIYAQIISRPENPFTHELNYIMVDQMSVSPEHRSQGYGELLMKRVFDLAREKRISRVMLIVWSFNERAREFYQRLGFATSMERMEITLETG
jgi:diamine N-acetyltransferase